MEIHLPSLFFFLDEEEEEEENIVRAEPFFAQQLAASVAASFSSLPVMFVPACCGDKGIW